MVNFRLFSLLVIMLLKGALTLSAQSYISIEAQQGYSKPIGYEQSQRAINYDLRAVRTGNANIQYNLVNGRHRYSFHVMGTTFGFRQYVTFPFTDSTNDGNIVGYGLPTDVEQTAIYHYRGIGLGYGLLLNKRNTLSLHLTYLKIAKIVITSNKTFPNPDPFASFSFAIKVQSTFDKSDPVFSELFNNQWNGRLVYSHQIARYFYLNCTYSSGLNNFVNFQYAKDQPILHQFVGLGLEFRFPQFRKKWLPLSSRPFYEDRP